MDIGTRRALLAPPSGMACTCNYPAAPAPYPVSYFPYYPWWIYFCIMQNFNTSTIAF